MNFYYFSTTIIIIYKKPCIKFSSFLNQRIKLFDIYRNKNQKLEIENVRKQL